MTKYRDDKLIKKIIDRIEKLRIQRGLTMKEFYLKTNIHFARIKSEKRDISVSHLNAICKYFKISLLEFFKGI